MNEAPTRLYFAYGSNLHPPRLRARTPSARALGRADLEGYRLLFHKLVAPLANEMGDAYTELVRRRQSWVRNLMRRCCGDETLADDLAQQVFLQVWRRIRQLREPTKFGSWLKRIAVNEWIQHQRRNDSPVLASCLFINGENGR